MFEVGDRVIRKRDGESGFITDSRTARVLMLEIRWDSTETKQWLPAEEFKAWDRSDAPPPVKLTWIGRTTPAYLVDLRRKNPLKKDPMKEQRRAEAKLADDMASLSRRKKTRSRNKARKMVDNYQKEFGTYTRYEARILKDRIARDGDESRPR